MAVVTQFSAAAATALMWSVALAAVVAVKLTGGSISALGWPFGALKYHAIAFALPIGYGLLAYGAASAMGLVRFPAPETVQPLLQAAHLGRLAPPLAMLALLYLLLTGGFLQAMTNALGEEIGWRGFLVPRLVAAHGFVVATLITGIIWSFWHVPLILFSSYNGGGDFRFELLSFFVAVVSMSAFLTWLRLSARSLWPCATFHASHNLFIQNLFDRFSVRGTGEITMVGEFGIVFAATVLLVSLPFWIGGAKNGRIGWRVHEETSNSA